MRIAVRLSAFDESNPHAYAIIWLDRERHQWSRESHLALALPSWGTLHAEPGATLLCCERNGPSLLRLEGLALDGVACPFEGEGGSVIWSADRIASRGHWYVQCVDDDVCNPEHGIFAEDSRLLGVAPVFR